MDQLSQTMQERARAKIERALSFSGGGDMDLINGKKSRTPRDQMSHRIIEKRRRDRMNNCLANLSQLIPVNYLKQGQGRIEKTEIIEMAIRHITQLQKQVQAMSTMERPCCQEKFLMGYKECRDEVMRFLVEKAAYDAADPFCLTLLKHLHKQSQKFVPESASSVYQTSAGCHQGAAGAGDMLMMPQNAGEIGGGMTLGDHGNGDTAVATETAAPADAQLKVNLHSPSWITPITDSTTELLPSPRRRHHHGNGSAAPAMLLQMAPAPLLSESGYSTSSRRSTVVCDGVQREAMVAGTHSGLTVTSAAPTPPSVRESPSSHGGVDSAVQMADNSPDMSDSTLSSKQVYKFKNDIKLRFVGASVVGGDKTGGGGGSGETSADQLSNSSKEEGGSSLSSSRHGNGGGKTSDYSSGGRDGGGDWPGLEGSSSSCSSNNGGGNEVRAATDGLKNVCETTAASSVKEDSDTAAAERNVKHDVPAFALHPLGTFYVPLVIKLKQLLPYLQRNASLQLCHPISIPVNFSRPEQSSSGVKSTPATARFSKCKTECGFETVVKTQQMDCS